MLALAALALALAAPGVDVMVAGRTTPPRVARAVAARQATVAVGGRRCAVAVATPLAALRALGRRGGPTVRVRDYGSCSGRPADGASLFVFQVGAERNRGADGWVYKVGRRVGSAGAADARGPFGAGRLRAGARVTWFWCRAGRAGGCQRTLEVVPAARAVAPGAALRVTVRAYDDRGRGVPAAGATVRLAGARARADRAGVATLAAPAAPGTYALGAQAPRLVPAFPERVAVR